MIEDHSVSNLHFVLLSPAFRLCFEEGLTLETSTSQTRFDGQFTFVNLKFNLTPGTRVPLDQHSENAFLTGTMSKGNAGSGFETASSG